MAIFGQLSVDKTAQLCDCVRIDASRSLVSKPDDLSSVDKVEIAPDGFNYIEIKASGETLAQKEWYLDHVYETTSFEVPEDNSDTSATNFSLLTTTLDRQAQSWRASVAAPITYYETNIEIGSGTPTGTVVVDLIDGLPSSPGAILATSSAINFSDLPASNTELTRFEFSTQVTPTVGNDYHFALRLDSTDTLGTLRVSYPAGNTYDDGQRWVSSDSGVSYTAQSNDLSFIVGQLVEATDGVVSPAVRITATDGRIISKSAQICLMTEEEDKLFSCDQDLRVHEQDILKMLPDGYCNWNHMHRRAQKLILEWFDDNGYTVKCGDKLTKENVLVKSELRDWSTYYTLQLIFESQSNSLDDVFRDKARHYEGLAGLSRHQYHRGIDWNGSGEIEKGEEKTHEISSTRLIRR